MKVSLPTLPQEKAMSLIYGAIISFIVAVVVKLVASQSSTTAASWGFAAALLFAGVIAALDWKRYKTDREAGDSGGWSSGAVEDFALTVAGGFVVAVAFALGGLMLS
jgi:hypothetical protein